MAYNQRHSVGSVGWGKQVWFKLLTAFSTIVVERRRYAKVWGRA